MNWRKERKYAQNHRSQDILLDSSIRAADVWPQSGRNSAGWARTTPWAKDDRHLFRRPLTRTVSQPTTLTKGITNMTTTFSRTLYWLGAFLLLTCALTIDAGASGGPAPLPGPTGVSSSSSALPTVR